MTDSSGEGLTELLVRAQGGDKEAVSEIAARVHGHLYRLAAQFFDGEPTGHTLQPTALINEAWIDLIGKDGGLRADNIANRGQFYALAATAMRHILVDYARARRADRRGGDRDRVMLNDHHGSPQRQPVDVLSLHEALGELERERPRAAKVIELRYFGGATIPDTAAALQISEESVKNDSRYAKSWLKRRMKHDV